MSLILGLDFDMDVDVDLDCDLGIHVWHPQSALIEEVHVVAANTGSDGAATKHAEWQHVVPALLCSEG